LKVKSTLCSWPFWKCTHLASSTFMRIFGTHYLCSLKPITWTNSGTSTSTKYWQMLAANSAMLDEWAVVLALILIRNCVPF
jgi:hypothetical protein